MPLYSANRELVAGEELPFFPCYGMDANGLDIGKAIAVDTETGEAWFYKRDADGNLVMEGDKFAIHMIKYAPPITLWHWGS